MIMSPQCKSSQPVRAKRTVTAHTTTFKALLDKNNTGGRAAENKKSINFAR